MIDSDEFQPTDDEWEAIKGINNAEALGKQTATRADLSQRLVEHGIVTKDETGHLVLTVRGKRLLRARYPS